MDEKEILKITKEILTRKLTPEEEEQHKEIRRKMEEAGLFDLAHPIDKE